MAEPMLVELIERFEQTKIDADEAHKALTSAMKSRKVHRVYHRDNYYELIEWGEYVLSVPSDRPPLASEVDQGEPREH